MEKMQAFLLEKTGEMTSGSRPLAFRTVDRPVPGAGEVLLQVKACGVCHTELDEIEGRTAPPVLPIIPGHQVVGEVVQCGEGAGRFAIGERVGVAWIYSACGGCDLCRRGLENLCHDFRATGRDKNGGYAEFMTVPESSAHPIPPVFSDSEAAPLLCGGAIGHRALRLAGIRNGDPLGLMGFGASAHIVLQLARTMYPESRVLVFARGERQRELGLRLGAFWSGEVEQTPPLAPQAIIDTTPAWGPVLAGLLALARGGRLVINAIRKERADFHRIGELSYEHHLWMEKEIKSVANITGEDVREFLQLAAHHEIRPQVTEYAFPRANEALVELKFSGSAGAKVLVMRSGKGS